MIWLNHKGAVLQLGYWGVFCFFVFYLAISELFVGNWKWSTCLYVNYAEFLRKPLKMKTYTEFCLQVWFDDA